MYIYGNANLAALRVLRYYAMISCVHCQYAQHASNRIRTRIRITKNIARVGEERVGNPAERTSGLRSISRNIVSFQVLNYLEETIFRFTIHQDVRRLIHGKRRRRDLYIFPEATRISGMDFHVLTRSK